LKIQIHLQNIQKIQSLPHGEQTSDRLWRPVS
jgi:hypothetical protein